MNIQTWILFAVILFAQNMSFTLVSRSRNSGSLRRHVIAALGSNGIWFASQLVTVSALTKILTGEKGWQWAVGAGLYYTIFTMFGSIAAHWWALRTEKGKHAVGASARYAQIPVEEWRQVRDYIIPAQAAHREVCKPYIGPVLRRP